MGVRQVVLCSSQARRYVLPESRTAGLVADEGGNVGSEWMSLFIAKGADVPVAIHSEGAPLLNGYHPAWLSWSLLAPLPDEKLAPDSVRLSKGVQLLTVAWLERFAALGKVVSEGQSAAYFDEVLGHRHAHRDGVLISSDVLEEARCLEMGVTDDELLNSVENCAKASAGLPATCSLDDQWTQPLRRRTLDDAEHLLLGEDAPCRTLVDVEAYDKVRVGVADEVVERWEVRGQRLAREEKDALAATGEGQGLLEDEVLPPTRLGVHRKCRDGRAVEPLRDELVVTRRVLMLKDAFDWRPSKESPALLVELPAGVEVVLALVERRL